MAVDRVARDSGFSISSLSESGKFIDKMRFVCLFFFLILAEEFGYFPCRAAFKTFSLPQLAVQWSCACVARCI